MLVTDLQLIWKQYLYGWFTIDVLSAFPVPLSTGIVSSFSLGDTSTLVSSQSHEGNWLSAEVSSGTIIESVAVYNRIDVAGSWPAQLGAFEIWQQRAR